MVAGHNSHRGAVGSKPYIVGGNNAQHVQLSAQHKNQQRTTSNLQPSQIYQNGETPSKDGGYNKQASNNLAQSQDG
jgi:hypothetical protein